MKGPHDHIHSAIRLLRPLLGAASGKRARGRARSEKRKADLAMAAPWFWGGNTIGICVSEKTAGGVRERGKPCLKFLVRKKLAKRQLPPDWLIPQTIEFRGIRGTLLTDVEVCRAAPVLHGTTGGGLASPSLRAEDEVINSRFREQGTAGLFVQRDGRRCVLSCAHVLAFGGPGVARVGQDRASNADSVEVATLLDFTPIADVEGSETDADAAISELDAGVRIAATKPASILDKEAGEFTDFSLVLVRKDSAGNVAPAIDSTGASIRIPYPDLGGRIVTVHGLVIYGAPGAPGDSGSAVFVQESGALAGMHIGGFGGASGDGATTSSLMTPIANVFRRLNIPLSLDSILDG